jgi:uncharacterized protein (DUF433 family)
MGRVLSWRHRAVKTGALFALRDDPRETPIYTVREAADYLDVPRSTLRHWIKAPKNGRAIIEVDSGGLLSFYNLLEAHVLRVALQRKAWLRRVRTGVETLRERLPHSKHPLLELELSTASGYRSLFTTTITGAVENLSFGGQFEFRELLRRYLSRIDWDANGPYQLRPFGYRHVGINHRVCGGRPVVKGTGILVEMIASRLRAGESPEDLAHDYRITTADVREARRYSAA